ncbi:hypothetical protein EZS27_034916 [termite gut metagenome]|uniref:Uncharacterized protein n=1 Tax=termite gut metagenome TaxID=433724 RepID=A0A5J4Q041_9ZZZZ
METRARFMGVNSIKFNTYFQKEEDCYSYLATIKWSSDQPYQHAPVLYRLYTQHATKQMQTWASNPAWDEVEHRTHLQCSFSNPVSPFDKP